MQVFNSWHFHHPYILLASSVPCIALSHLESWCKLRRCIQILGMICSVIHKPHYIFLKTATIPTYHGISIAIPRYTVVQLPSFVYMTSSLSYLLCTIIDPHDSRALPFTSSLLHDALDLCTSCYTGRGIQFCLLYFLQF